MGIVCAGYNDLQWLNEGWYGVEKSPEGILYRASGPVGVLRFPWEGRVMLSLYLSARPEHSGEPLRVLVKSQDDAGFYFTLVTNGWTLRRGSVVLGKERKIRIEAQNPWSPDSIYNNGDARSLGILLCGIRFD